jgi:regulator of replication initiation timing
MGYQVIRMAKLQGKDLAGIESHMMRKHPSKTNIDIDYERSKDNVVLVDAGNLKEKVQARIDELHLKRCRKDAVRCVDFLVTASPESMNAMSEKQQQQYFEKSLKWLKSRYGSENVMYAVVHRDEATPHMDVGIVPVTRDGRLSAKSIFTKKELTAVQDDFHEAVAKHYGLERGVRGSEAKHLSDMRYKSKLAADELEEANNKLSARRKMIENVSTETIKRGFLGRVSNKNWDVLNKQAAKGRDLQHQQEVIDEKRDKVRKMYTNASHVELVVKRQAREQDERKSALDAREQAVEARETAVTKREQDTNIKRLLAENRTLRMENETLKSQTKAMKAELDKRHYIQTKNKSVRNRGR